MAVIQNNRAVEAAKPRDFSGDGGMIRIEIFDTAQQDCRTIRLHAVTVKRLAVKRGGGAKPGRGLAGVERGAGGITVHVNDGA